MTVSAGPSVISNLLDRFQLYASSGITSRWLILAKDSRKKHDRDGERFLETEEFHNRINRKSLEQS